MKMVLAIGQIITAMLRQQLVVVACGQTLTGQTALENVCREKITNVIQRQANVVPKVLIQVAISEFIMSVGLNACK